MRKLHNGLMVAKNNLVLGSFLPFGIGLELYISPFVYLGLTLPFGII
jgi:hypothetical protein